MSARWRRHKRRGATRRAGSRRTFALAILVAAAALASAQAQMQLPGTSGAAPEGGAGGTGSGSSAAPSTYAPPKPVSIAAPGEATIAGHPLSRDGSKGEMTFTREEAGGKARGQSTGLAGGLSLTKLTLSGDKISKPGQVCTVDASPPAPLAATPAGRPAGAIRYAVALPACPFTIDILDGAVLATGATATCDFAAADCRVSVNGLWGPRAADITPKRAKELERENRRLETTMLTNFRALLRKAGKDKAAVKSIAHDQAAFSSEREMTCRDYDGEAVHGFCSTQVTQARALALMAQFGPLASEPRRRPSQPRPERQPPAEAPPPR